MNYTIYEKNHVAVHKDNCSSLRKTGRYYEGIASIAEALRFAFSVVGNRTLTICKRCFPKGIHLEDHYKMMSPMVLEDQEGLSSDCQC